jgi:hypothetical protein
LVNEVTHKGHDVLEVLERLKAHMDAKVNTARERHQGRLEEIGELEHDVDKLERVLVRVWQAIGMTEGLLETLEKARQESRGLG